MTATPPPMPNPRAVSGAPAAATTASRGTPVAVVPAGVTHGHDQRPEDRREDVPPLRWEHTHEDQQPQHDREDGTCAG